MKNKEELLSSLTAELEVLSTNLTKISLFRKTKDYANLHKEAKTDLEKQEYYMAKYEHILNKRIKFIETHY